jgi:hypothetical protein
MAPINFNSSRSFKQKRQRAGSAFGQGESMRNIVARYALFPGDWTFPKGRVFKRSFQIFASAQGRL